MYMHICKPVISSLLAGMALVILSPLLLTISVLLFLSTRKSPFFLQTRVGYQGKLFKIIKFKTMTDARDEHGRLLPNNQRLFPLGNFLRTNSLDELPQLINILKGDMVIVGPRPWIPSQMEALPPNYCRQRYSVRPGITGMAQIHGRNGIPFCRRLCYDVLYVRRVSFLLDVSLVFRTAGKSWSGKASSNATRPSRINWGKPSFRTIFPSPLPRRRPDPSNPPLPSLPFITSTNE